MKSRNRQTLPFAWFPRCSVTILVLFVFLLRCATTWVLDWLIVLLWPGTSRQSGLQETMSRAGECRIVLLPAGVLSTSSASLLVFTNHSSPRRWQLPASTTTEHITWSLSSTHKDGFRLVARSSIYGRDTARSVLFTLKAVGWQRQPVPVKCSSHMLQWKSIVL